MATNKTISCCQKFKHLRSLCPNRCFGSVLIPVFYVLVTCMYPVALCAFLSPSRSYCVHINTTQPQAVCEIIHCAVAVDSRIKSSRACTRLMIYEMRRRERRGAFVWIQLGSRVALWFHPRFLPAQLICQQCSCTRALTWGAGLTNSASTRMMLTFTDAKKSTGFLPRKSSNHDKACKTLIPC